MTHKVLPLQTDGYPLPRGNADSRNTGVDPSILMMSSPLAVSGSRDRPQARPADTLVYMPCLYIGPLLGYPAVDLPPTALATVLRRGSPIA